MTVVTLRPGTEVQSGPGTLVGAASKLIAVNDSSDSSYIEFTGSAGDGLGWWGAWADLSLPSGAVIRRMSVKHRAAAVGSASAYLDSYIDNGDDSAPLRYAFQSALIQSGGTIFTSAGATINGATTPGVGGESAGVAVNDSFADAAGSLVVFRLNNSGTLRLYELYLDVTYVEKPTLTVDAPVDASTLTDTNLPLVSWTPTLDADGGPQTFYEVKIFTAAEVADGGFNATGSTPTVGWTNGSNGGRIAGNATAWLSDTTLVDGAYYAFVRVAQTVNGALQESDWESSSFAVDVDLPAVPDLDATANDSNGRNDVTVTANSGDATTDYFEIQFSPDGGTTWLAFRDLGAQMPYHYVGGGSGTVYDYEAPNGVAGLYRARALHDYSGVFAGSDWATATATWSSNDWWLKHPNSPALKTVFAVRSLPTLSRSGRQGVFQALGATDLVVVSDTRTPSSGQVTLRCDTAADQDALDALLDESSTLLLQSPAGYGGPDYIRVTGHARSRVIDQGKLAPSFNALDFVVVARPPGSIDGWS